MNAALRQEYIRWQAYVGGLSGDCGGYGYHPAKTAWALTRENLLRRGVIPWEDDSRRRDGWKRFSYARGDLTINLRLMFDPDCNPFDMDVGELYETEPASRAGLLPYDTDRYSRRPTSWFRPPETQAALAQYYRRAGASRSVAWDLARASQLRSLAYYRQLTRQEVCGFALLVTVTRKGVELGGASLSGIIVHDNDEDDAYITACAEDLVREALVDAEKTLAELRDGLDEAVLAAQHRLLPWEDLPACRAEATGQIYAAFPDLVAAMMGHDHNWAALTPAGCTLRWRATPATTGDRDLPGWFYLALSPEARLQILFQHRGTGAETVLYELGAQATRDGIRDMQRSMLMTIHALRGLGVQDSTITIILPQQAGLTNVPVEVTTP